MGTSINKKTDKQKNRLIQKSFTLLFKKGINWNVNNRKIE